MRSLACAQDLRQIEMRLSALSATDQRRWGRMSVDGMVSHLYECFRMAAGERSAAPVRGPLPPRVLKLFALRMPLPWPKNMETVPELKSEEAFASEEVFLQRKAAMFTAMQRFLRSQELAPEHPFFESMAPADWMRWGYLHTDHHLRQFGR